MQQRQQRSGFDEPQRLGVRQHIEREFERDAEAEGARLKALVELGEKEAIAARVGEAIRSLAADPDVKLSDLAG